MLNVASDAGDDYFGDITEDLEFLRQVTKLDKDKTNFPALDSYQVNAKVATEKTYPWIAQVIHSRSRNFPYMCTAVCVHDGIFMTASRCIYSLKVSFTSILYQSKRQDVRAFIVPSKTTVQQFDDIGFIVLDKKAGVKFAVAPLYAPNEVKRTDEAFNWFTKLNVTGPFKVVGYVMEKEKSRLKLFNSTYYLRDLTVVINIDLCWNIFTNEKRNGFHVPCYHSCSLATFKKLAGNCTGYLAVEGAAVVHDKTKKVLGLATWGPKFKDFDLPVGFSVVNSKTFQEDFACAKKVRNAKSKAGNYQALCKR